MEYTLEKPEVYQLAETFSDSIWNTVSEWNFFLKDTIGKQIVRSADSVSANIAEGYGGIITGKANSFSFIQEAHCRKQKHG